MIFDSYNNSQNNIINEEFRDPTLLEQVFIADEVAHLSEDKIHEFCQPGGVGEQLVKENDEDNDDDHSRNQRSINRIPNRFKSSM